MYKIMLRSIILVLVFSLVACNNSQNIGVRHLVIFKFSEGTSPNQINELTTEFISLRDKIPGILAFDYGVNNSPEKLNKGFTHIYAISFADTLVRSEYLVHPEHQKFVDYAGKLGIIEDVFVLDYPPIGVSRF